MEYSQQRKDPWTYWEDKVLTPVFLINGLTTSTPITLGDRNDETDESEVFIYKYMRKQFILLKFYHIIENNQKIKVMIVVLKNPKEGIGKKKDQVERK